MLDALIPSKTRAKVLTLFFTHPGERFYLRQIERLTGAPMTPVRLEVARLEQAGLLVSQQEGKVKYYSVNRNCPIYPELKGLVLKTNGLGDALRQALQQIGNIQAAFIYGSFAAGEERANSDLDLMLIGDVELGALREVLRELEGKLSREINETVFGIAEFKQRKTTDSFLARVLNGPKIMLVGNTDLL